MATGLQYILNPEVQKAFTITAADIVLADLNRTTYEIKGIHSIVSEWAKRSVILTIDIPGASTLTITLAVSLDSDGFIQIVTNSIALSITWLIEPHNPDVLVASKFALV